MIDLTRQPMHDAAGINDDYPVGRGIFIEEENEFFVLINFEDHIQIIVSPENGQINNFSKAMTKLIKLNQTFEKIGFATDSYLGFLLVNPENLGTGLKIEASIKLPPKANFAELEKSLNEELMHTKYIAVNVENVDGESLLVNLKSG